MILPMDRMIQIFLNIFIKTIKKIILIKIYILGREGREVQVFQ